MQRKEKTVLEEGKVAYEVSEVPPWVFTNEVGKPLDTDNFRRRVWPRLLAKAGLREIRIHNLRHPFASLLI